MILPSTPFHKRIESTADSVIDPRPSRKQERPPQPLDRRLLAQNLHRPQQPRPIPLHRPRTHQYRHPHLPRRRLRLRPFPRSTLQQPPALPLRHQRGLLPHPARVRAGQDEHLQANRTGHPSGRRGREASCVHWGHVPAEPRGGESGAGGAGSGGGE